MKNKPHTNAIRHTKTCSPSLSESHWHTHKWFQQQQEQQVQGPVLNGLLLPILLNKDR